MLAGRGERAALVVGRLGRGKMNFDIKVIPIIFIFHSSAPVINGSRNEDFDPSLGPLFLLLSPLSLLTQRLSSGPSVLSTCMRGLLLPPLLYPLLLLLSLLLVEVKGWLTISPATRSPLPKAGIVVVPTRRAITTTTTTTMSSGSSVVKLLKNAFDGTLEGVSKDVQDNGYEIEVSNKRKGGRGSEERKKGK